METIWSRGIGVINEAMESNKEVMPLEKYIEELKFYYNLYSTNGDEDSAEELMMYEQLIDWLEELKRRREGEYPYMADFIDEE